MSRLHNVLVIVVRVILSNRFLRFFIPCCKPCCCRLFLTVSFNSKARLGWRILILPTEFNFLHLWDLIVCLLDLLTIFVMVESQSVAYLNVAKKFQQRFILRLRGLLIVSILDGPGNSIMVLHTAQKIGHYWTVGFIDGLLNVCLITKSGSILIRGKKSIATTLREAPKR